MSIYPSGSLIGGRFEVAGRPLMGGQGIVYLCIDRQEQRPVALKTFRPGLLPNRAARDRFLREGTHWVDLGAHPHIVRCYQVVRVSGGTEVYLALELVAKEPGRADASLRSWLVPGRPLPEETALLFALQAARGMAHAVTTVPGFVHRDLKPENLLVGADRLSGSDAVKGMWFARIVRRRAVRPAGVAANRLRVTDFGLVRVMDTAETVSAAGEDERLPTRPGLTRLGRILGTPPYMAPEQWDSPEVDLRADVYALGCILGEMLIGQPLVQKRTPQGFRQAHQGGHASQLVRDLPGCLMGVLGSCLAVDPAARYRSWGEVEVALEAAYEEVTGREAPAPEPETGLGKGQAERAAAGWSYNALGISYMDLGQAETAVSYFERSRAAGAAEGSQGLEATGLANLGLAHADLGDARRSIRYLEQALEILRRVGDQRWRANAYLHLGRAYLDLGDARYALDCCQQALAILREIGDRSLEEFTLDSMGAAYARLGDVRGAISYFDRALTIVRETGNRRSEERSLGNLGVVHLQLGNIRRAIGYHEQALAIAREIGNRRGEGTNLGNLARAHASLGDTRRAIGYHEQALAIAREISDRRGESYALAGLGRAHLELGDVSCAIGYYEQKLAITREIGDRHGEGYALGGLGSAHHELGEVGRAVEYHEQALVIHREIGNRHGEGQALSNLGAAYADLGNTRLAAERWQQAAAILEEIGDVVSAAGVGWNLARLLVQQGRHAAALPHAQRAAQVWTQIGHTQHMQRARNLLNQIQAALR